MAGLLELGNRDTRREGTYTLFGEHISIEVITEFDQSATFSIFGRN